MHKITVQSRVAGGEGGYVGPLIHDLAAYRVSIYLCSDVTRLSPPNFSVSLKILYRALSANVSVGLTGNGVKIRHDDHSVEKLHEKLRHSLSYGENCIRHYLSVMLSVNRSVTARRGK